MQLAHRVAQLAHRRHIHARCQQLRCRHARLAQLRQRASRLLLQLRRRDARTVQLAHRVARLAHRRHAHSRRQQLRRAHAHVVAQLRQRAPRLHHLRCRAARLLLLLCSVPRLAKLRCGGRRGGPRVRGCTPGLAQLRQRASHLDEGLGTIARLEQLCGRVARGLHLLGRAPRLPQRLGGHAQLEQLLQLDFGLQEQRHLCRRERLRQGLERRVEVEEQLDSVGMPPGERRRERRHPIALRVRVGVAAQLLEHALGVAVGGVVDEHAALLELALDLRIHHRARSADALGARHLRERRHGSLRGLGRSLPEHRVPLDEGRLPVRVLYVQAGVPDVEEDPHAPLVPTVHGVVQRRVTLAVGRVDVRAVQHHGVHYLGVAARRGVVHERARVSLPQQLAERCSALALVAAKVLAPKLERVDHAIEVALGARRLELAHHLKVAVAGRLLCAQHRLGAQLELAQVTVDFDHQLDVAVAAVERRLVAVVELPHTAVERADHVLQPTVEAVEVGVLQRAAHEVGQPVPRDAVALGVTILEERLHARAHLSLDRRHDCQSARVLRQLAELRVEDLMSTVGLRVQLLEAADVRLVDEPR